MTAGGGGGQGTRNDTGYAGGGSANGNGTQSGQGVFEGGTGGSSTNPGLGAIDALININAQNGYYLTGGSALDYGGGGGGGYFGGGGGGVEQSNATQTGTGGGGGGSHIDSNVVLSFISGNGSGSLPGGTTNFYYRSGIGQGGGRSNAGGNGLIVFNYLTVTVKPQVSPEGLFNSLYIENLTTNNIQVQQPHIPLYVAVGNGVSSSTGDPLSNYQVFPNNSIQYSHDGFNWFNVNNMSNNFQFGYGQSVGWNGQYWLAGGFDLTNGAIKYSQDGSNWINSGIGTFDATTADIKWNGQYWLAVGYYTPSNIRFGSTILYSADGFTWVPTSNSFTGLTVSAGWNGEYWIATGGSGNYILGEVSLKRSYDGRQWTDINLGTLSNFSCGAYGGSRVGWNGKMWVVVGYNPPILYSLNGSNWFGTNITSGSLTGVAWSGQYWMAVGSFYNISNYIGVAYVSTDGSNWSSNGYQTNIFDNRCKNVIWDGSKWLIVGANYSNTSCIKISGKDLNGNFIWKDTTTGGQFYGQGGEFKGAYSIAYNNSQLPYLQNANFAMYQRTNTQPLYDTPSNNFIKTVESLLNINNTLYINLSTITNVTYINSKVGIFQPNPSFSLQLLNDSASKPGTNTWTNTSDRRVKENIEEADLEICLSTLMTLPIRTYSYISSFAEKTELSQELRYGLIAQEVQVPHTVTKMAAYGYEDFHYLNTDQIHYIHLGATQALLQQKNQQLSTTKAAFERLTR